MSKTKKGKRTEYVLAHRHWLMLDADNKRVGTPCHDADWLEPYLLTALCAVCAEPYDLEMLGIVRGVR